MRKAHLGSKHVLSTEAKISFRQKMSGENSPNWRGGITSFNKIERAKFRQKVQKQVFERDNYTCQICGIYGKQLQVDHIQSWKDYIEARFDLSNCRTLCMDCHYWITFHREKPKDVIWGHNLKHIFERRVD
jgi:5-methylcytosine-specific restriction endonuclease McrA